MDGLGPCLITEGRRLDARLEAARGRAAAESRFATAGTMARIVSDRLVEHLERSSFVVMKRQPAMGGAAIGRGHGADELRRQLLDGSGAIVPPNIQARPLC
jgi:hypothetical protein